MKLWRLYTRTPHEGCFQWDTHQGFVIRAESEILARVIASDSCYQYAESGSLWLDADYTLCEEVSVDGDAGLILADYNAG